MLALLLLAQPDGVVATGQTVRPAWEIVSFPGRPVACVFLASPR